VYQTEIVYSEQSNNLDPVSANPFPGTNINDENTLRYKSVKSILDDVFKF
jgi:hypothetical protein